MVAAIIAAINLWGYGLVEIVVTLLIVVGVIVIVFLALTEGMGITIPPWMKKAFLIVVSIFVAIVLIKILVSM